jgi:hypothetical protein
MDAIDGLREKLGVRRIDDGIGKAFFLLLLRSFKAFVISSLAFPGGHKLSCVLAPMLLAFCTHSNANFAV